MVALFDFTPLTTYHAALFLGSFTALFFCLQAIVRRQPIALKVTKHAGVIYGGVAIATTTVLFAGFLLLSLSQLISLVVATVVILIVGTWDERKSLPASRQLIVQIGIAIVLIVGGWSIPYVSNPFGEGVLSLQTVWLGILFWPSALVTLIWLVGLMNVVNWLDGADGLAPAVMLIAFLSLMAVSVLPATQDGQTLALAAVGAGVSLACLLWNMPPAKMYLGTVGVWFLAIYLGKTNVIFIFVCYNLDCHAGNWSC